MKIDGENGTVSLLSDIIEVSTDGDVKTQIGNVNGQFVFNITDNNGNSAVNITDKGNMNFKGDFETEKLSVGIMLLHRTVTVCCVLTVKGYWWKENKNEIRF